MPRVQRASITKGTSVSIVTKVEADRHNWEVREHIVWEMGGVVGGGWEVWWVDDGRCGGWRIDGMVVAWG